MDPLKLLSRGSKPSRSRQPNPQAIPSNGQNVLPQLYSADIAATKKRKRDEPEQKFTANDRDLDFFGSSSLSRRHTQAPVLHHESSGGQDESDISSLQWHEMSREDTKRTLREHKLKFTLMNPLISSKHGRRKDKGTGGKGQNGQVKEQLYPQPLQTFEELRSRFNIGKRLADNIADQGFKMPTEVQLGALPILLDASHGYSRDDSGSVDGTHIDLLTVAPTGSGKTLTFLIPLIHRLQNERRDTSGESERRTTAIVLAPTKELVNQIVNEGRKLCQGTGVKIAQFKKGMRLQNRVGQEKADGGHKAEAVIKTDIVVSTPGILESIVVGDHDSALSEVRHFVIDEADALLDPLFKEQTLNIWNSLSHAHLRVSLWSATMGSSIEELAQSTIASRYQRLEARNAPLVRFVVGLKDSAVPNIVHRLTYAATEQGKLMGLRQLIRPSTSNSDSGPPLRPPFLIFTQTIERAIALHSELRYDIPAAAGGITRIEVLHSDLSDVDREHVMTRFRNGEIWVLITTDLLSRGVDFRGVNGVVNYDIPTSAAAYVHRVGRTGRAGRDGGVAVTLYTREDIPYLKHIANIVASAQKGGKDNEQSLQPWLLNALPELNKAEKRKLKIRGIEARSSRARESDPKAARRARISTRAGYIRKRENDRKDAVAASRRHFERDNLDTGDETDFAGFD